MEALFLVLLGIPALAVAGGIAGLVALARVAALRREVVRLREELVALAARPGPVEGEPRAVVNVEPEARPVAEAPAPVAPAVGGPAPGPVPGPGVSPPVVTPAPGEPVPAPAASPPGPRGGRDWERWLGVRGAAVVGGGVLALAALLLYQYGVERGLIGPAERVAMGLAAGLVCLLGSLPLHRRHPEAADALAGAGAVALYASLWAARQLYGLVPTGVAFAGMAAVTVICGLLAVGRGSALVAGLGLAGGFATPLLVGSPTARPAALFAYLALLDAAVLATGRERWRWLVPAALGATWLYEVGWVLGWGAAPDVWLGVAVAAGFAALFSLAGGSGRLAAAALALAAAPALAPALHPAAGPWPVVVVAASLAGLGLLVAGRLGAPGLGTAGGLAAAALLVARAAAAPLPHPAAWALAAAAAGLAAACRLAAEAGGLALAAGSAAVTAGAFVTALVGAGWGGALEPWLVAGAVAVALALRHAAAPGPPAWAAVAGVVAPLPVLAWAVALRPDAAAPPVALWAPVALAGAVAAAARGRESEREWWEGGAWAAAVVGLAAVVALRPAWVGPGPSALDVAAFLGLLALWWAARRAAAAMFAATAVALALAEMAVVPRGDAWAGLDAAVLLASAAAVILLPSRLAGALAATPLAWPVAALAGPVWLPVLLGRWRDLAGRGWDGVPAVALAALELAALAGPGVRPGARGAAGWHGGAAVGLAAIAVALQFHRHWITVGWAALALVVLAVGLARRSGTARWASLVLLMATLAKAFLWDLGNLRDLSRVAALVGLALSLIAVSVVYRRWVLPRDA